MKKIIILLFLLSFFSVSNAAYLKGPQYFDIRAMGMGNTTVAVTTDRTAIFHNPAGLGLLGEKIQISIAPITVSIDGKFMSLVNVLGSEGSKLSDISNIDKEFIDKINQYDGQWVGLQFIPEFTIASRNIGFGIYSVWPVGTMIESGHLIPKLGIRGQRDLVFTWAFGVPLKHKNHHMGVSIAYLQRNPVNDTITKFSDTFIYFKKLSSGLKAFGVLKDFSEVNRGVSFNIGMMHDWGIFRLAYEARDILSVIGGEMVFPPNLILGGAFFVPNLDKVKGIDNIIISAQISEMFSKDPRNGKAVQFAKKLHAGFEFDVHYAQFRAGINQGYPTAGIGLKFGLFKAEYVFFQEEFGLYAGQLPVKKHVFSLSFDFETKRKKRRNELDDFVDDGEKDYLKDAAMHSVIKLKDDGSSVPAPKQSEVKAEESKSAPAGERGR